jgi:DNA-binding transcriptional LysR family regulator
MYPQVQISVYRNFSRKILERVEDGTVDLGIATLPVRAPSLKVYPIFRDRIMLMVANSNPLSQKPTVTLDDVAKQPLIFPKTGFTRQLLDRCFRPYRPDLRVVMELPSVGMIKAFVAADLGISLISAAFAREDVAAGRVKLIDLEDVDLWRELGLAYRRDRTLPRSSAAFIALLRERAGRKLEGWTHSQ